MICAECNLCSRSFFLAKWLFKLEELVLHLEARFNSDWCIAFLFAFCLSSRIFNSVELEWLGLEDRNNSALWREAFLQRLFLIKGRWFITFLGRGNPVPCYLNMHFPEEIERTKSVAVDTVSCHQVKYLIRHNKKARSQKVYKIKMNTIFRISQSVSSQFLCLLLFLYLHLFL